MHENAVLRSLVIDLFRLFHCLASLLTFALKQTPKTMKQLYFTSLAFISGIIVFGGLIAPTVSTKNFYFYFSFPFLWLPCIVAFIDSFLVFIFKLWEFDCMWRKYRKVYGPDETLPRLDWSHVYSRLAPCLTPTNHSLTWAKCQIHVFLYHSWWFNYTIYISWQLELKLGLGGTSYEDFIRNMHLPLQLRYLLSLSSVTKLKTWSN